VIIEGNPLAILDDLFCPQDDILSRLIAADTMLYIFVVCNVETQKMQFMREMGMIMTDTD
jgi:hypothetical protein